MNNFTPNETVGLFDEDRHQIRLYNNLTFVIWRYVLMVPVFGGCVANLLCLLTLQMSSFRECAAGFLLSALTVVDMVSLALGGIHAWIIGTFDFDLRRLSINVSRVHTYFTYLTVHLSAWTLALITLERLVAVTRPLEVACLCTRRRMTLAWITITITLAVTDLCIPLNIDRMYVTNTTENATVATGVFIFNNANVVEWVDMCFSFFVPFITILCGNMAILYRLFIARNDNLSRSADPKTRSITVMLLLASVMFFVTSLPVNIYFLGYDVFFPNENENELTSAKRWFTAATASTIYYFNNAGNFILYLLSGPRFRNEFKGIFCKTKQEEPSPIISNISEAVSKRESEDIVKEPKVNVDVQIV